MPGKDYTIKPVVGLKTNNNEARMSVKPETGIEVIRTSYWRLKRGLMVPGGLQFFELSHPHNY